MRNLPILLLSLALFACGGGESDDSSAAAVETVDESPQTVGADVADTMQDAMDKAANVGELLDEQKAAIDEALDEAEAVD
jgi:hypothetical protein